MAERGADLALGELHELEFLRLPAVIPALLVWLAEAAAAQFLLETLSHSGSPDEFVSRDEFASFRRRSLVLTRFASRLGP